MGTMLFPYGRRQRAEPLRDAPPVEADAVTVMYPGAKAPAVQDVSFTVCASSLVALIGPNGSGKSTLLKAAAGLLKPVEGALRVFGRPSGVCRPHVAYLPQRSEIDWRFPISVRRLVITGRYVHRGWLRRPNRLDAALADEALARLRLTGLAGCQIGRLSGGQQQRTLLARALVQQARLLLLDEPLNAVDAETGDIITHTLAGLRHDGVAVVVATHDYDRRAGAFDAVIRLEVPRSELHGQRFRNLGRDFGGREDERGTRNLELGTHRWIG